MRDLHAEGAGLAARGAGAVLHRRAASDGQPVRPDSPAAAIAAGYAFLPFVMCAGLSVFPITAIEGMLFASHWSWRISWPGLRVGDLPVQLYLGAMWPLLLAVVGRHTRRHEPASLPDGLGHQSPHDKLTGTYARRIGEEMLNLQFGNARRNKRPLSLVFVDLDDFKKVNDRYGHDEGDRVLRTAAQPAERCGRAIW